ncbi:MAG: hypothetical protein OHK0046_12160 [Anaerolineae bacterium]
MSDYTPHEAPIREAPALPVTPPLKLVGRDGALSQVYTQLKAGNPVLVHGPAGAGKTALAAALAAAYAQQPGGVLWLSVNHPTLDELLVRVGRAYQDEDITRSENPTAMIGAVENTLTRNKPFIVLDGAIDPDVASRFISRCVNGLPLLMTSEPRLEGAWAVLELNRLEPEAATALFKQEARITVDDHDIDIYGLVKLVNYLPLAIVIAARSMILSKQMPGEYLKIIQQMAQATGGNGPIAALTASFRGLTGALQGLILMMGATFNGQASAELLSMISGAPLESVQQAMNILAQINFVQRSTRYGLPYYRMHSLVHAFAQASLRGSNRLDDLQNKVLQSIVAYAQKYAVDTDDAYNHLAAEMENILAAARFAADKGSRTTASDLVRTLTRGTNVVTARGYLYEVLRLRTIAAESITAFPAYPQDERPEDALDMLDEDEYEEDDDVINGDFDSEAPEDMFDDEELDEDLYEEVDEDADAAEADVFLDLETQDTTELRTMLATLRQSGEQRKQIDVLNTIGRLQVSEGRQNEAIATYNEALDIYEELDDARGILATLRTLADLMVKTENAQAAITYTTRGIKLAESDDAARLALLILAGDAHQQLGESADAVQNYTQALELARRLQDPDSEAITLYKLGYAQLDDGQPETAVQTWERALALFKSQGKREYEGRVLGGLGSAYGDMDRWSESINYHTSALYIAREVGSKDEEAQQLTNLAYAATQARQLGEAVMRYRQALHLAYLANNKDRIVSTIVDLTRLLVESRKHVSVAELLINDALSYGAGDMDVQQLKERVDSERKLAEAYEVKMVPIHGTARTYAENAYRLLEN